MNFGTELQKQRMRRRLTRAEVARLAGLSAPAISRLERESRRPVLATVGKLADAFRLSGEERDDWFIAAGYAPPQGDWRLSRKEPLVAWIADLLAHPAMNEAARERFLAPGLRTMGIIAASFLVRQGIAFEDLPQPPRGSGLTAEVVNHEMRFGVALVGE